MATFFGTNGNNSWTLIEPGSFTIDGRGGVDTVDFGIMFQSDFIIQQGPQGQVFVDSVSAASGQLHATLINIELLQFGNRSITLDLRTFFTPPVSAITGTPGNDLLIAGNGRQRFDGLDGIDTLQLAGTRAAWSLAPRAEGGFTLARANPAADIELHSIERLHFDDQKLALDFDPARGHAAITAMILGAVFGRESVHNTLFVGIGLALLDGGMAFEPLIQLAMDVRLGAGFSTAQMVDLLYTNVVGFAPSPEVNKGFADLVDLGLMSAAQLGVLAATHPLNTAGIDLTGLAQNGLPYI